MGTVMRKGIPFAVASAAGMVDGLILTKAPGSPATPALLRPYLLYRAALPIAGWALERHHVIPLPEAETMAISGITLLSSQLGHSLYQAVVR